MQHYRHYGTSCPPEPCPAPVEEEVYAEEEVYGEEAESLIQEEAEPMVKQTDGKTAVESKNGKRSERGGGGGEGGGEEEEGGGGGGTGTKYSMFTWFVVLALLGVWSSVAVVYFEVVDYDSVIARAKEFPMNLSDVLQGKLTAYDTDGDGDFDVEDAKVLLGLKAADRPPEERADSSPSSVHHEDGNDEAAVPPLVEDVFVPEDHTETIDTTGVLLEERPPEESPESGRYLTSSKFSQQSVGAENRSEPVEPQPQSDSPKEARGDLHTHTAPPSGKPAEEKLKEKAKTKKPKLLNKFDKTIKVEIDAAEKLRKKGKLEEALRAFESLVEQNPQSPRARYGRAQVEDDLAEKLRSNDMLQKAINSYREAAELPDATSDLLRAALKRRAERQQFLGRIRGSLATLEKMVQIFPDDISLRNEMGVAHLLLGDNKGASRVFGEVLAVAPSNGFAKVHYGFILKSENKIAESIPYLKDGIESGEPGTDDGRFYFHLGDALQRVGDESAYRWYELGHKRGHFASVWQRSLYNVDGLKAQPWWTAKETGYTDLVRTLERNWKTIRDEALAMMDQKTGSFVPEEENLRERGEWGQYTLWQQGKKVGNACQGVPKTCSLLEKHSEATGCRRGQIKFSVMHPGTHVWPHTGPTNCRLRMHLGLVVPKHGCKIRCTDQTREWEEGRVLIFDDSFEHEVWQEAGSYRLIFIVDVWHPELTGPQRHGLSAI
ncbi:aspartyl/asparaginyl beta-hydroxylase-like isoform 6-T6 [Spinachia spinachia]